LITRKLRSLSLPWPTDWAAIFGADRPLIVEIGFGDAEFLLHLAQQNPDQHIIGLEISSESMQKAEKKIRQAQLANVCAVHSTAETALYHLFEPASISRLHINNPDPWFKERHSTRRLIQTDTVEAMVSRLRIGAMLYLVTDVPAYAEMSHGVLSQIAGLTNTLPTPWTDHLPGRIVTKYEARGLRQGNPPKMFAYRRNEVPALPIPVIRELPMPHAIIHTPLTATEILAQFQRQTHHAGDEIYITFMQAFANQDSSGLLFEVSITEPTIDQHIAIMLFPREEPQQYTLRSGGIGAPRITEGVHRAVAFWAQWLVNLHPAAQLIALRTKNP
jgi:tRNA (guanine-N7-)-methyltransferase